MREDEIIDKFARYINQIENTISTIDNPIKEHQWDLNYTEYRENFVRGGKIWTENF